MEIFYSDMENTLAKVILAANSGNLNGIHNFFSENARLTIDMNIAVNGNQSIEELFKNIESKRRETDYIIFTASPAYQQDDDMGKSGKISCDAYVYVLKRPHKTCYLRMMRMETVFTKKQGCAQINQLFMYTIQTMKPWAYTGSEDYPDRKRYSLTALQNQTVDPQAYVQLKNFSNTIWDRLGEKIEDLFLNLSDFQMFQKKICSKDPQKPSIYISSMPAVNIDDHGKEGTVVVMLESFEISGAIDHNELLKRKFYLERLTVEKLEKSWKIKQIDLLPLISLPDTLHLIGERYDLMSKGISHWSLGNSLMPGQYPSDSYEIETILNAWVTALRRGDLTSFPLVYMNHPGLIPHMLIKGREDSHELIGLNQIVNKTSGMDNHGMERMISYHTATTPVIEFSEDGTFARGTWFDHSATNMYSASICQVEGASADIPYMIFIARYIHEFKKIDSQWYLSDFYWEPLINLDNWYLNIQDSEGWITRQKYETYPNPFEIPVLNT